MEFEMGSISKAVFQRQQQISDSNNNTGSDGAKPKKKITDFFQIKRVGVSGKQQKSEKADKQDFLYLGAGNVTAEELMNNGGRMTVTVNDMEVSLVAYNNQVYAMEPKCPHVGGPLHLGDIEEVPGCGPCIKCPWHSWRFSLTSGQCIAPQNRSSTHKLKTYPVRLDPTGNEIRIGFSEISPNIFNSIPE